MARKNIWLEGIMGVVVGDALGLPVQFCDRKLLEERPVTKMESYGTFHMPAGTWSDDSSLTLATLDSIREKREIDLEDIMNRFVEWLYQGHYTPFGEAFDEGNTCVYAISTYRNYHDVKNCGKTGVYANGNGALMRIMPVCLYGYEKWKAGELPEESVLDMVHSVSSLTHNHLRSKMACGIYYFMVKAIVEEQGSLKERLQKGITAAKAYYQKDVIHYAELAQYSRIMDLKKWAMTGVEEVSSSGYVVDSLEAVLWCLITTNSLQEALLKAVNLGRDTDTVAAIAGGLAVLYYGYESIPTEWLEVIAQRENIEAMCACMIEECMEKL